VEANPIQGQGPEAVRAFSPPESKDSASDEEESKPEPRLPFEEHAPEKKASPKPKQIKKKRRRPKMPTVKRSF
jgi:hypothetical protein